MPRYTVSTPAEGQVAGWYLGSAILPAFTRMAGSWQSRGRVYGSPGTARVPSPRPTYSGHPIQKAQGGLFYSDNAPDWFLPAVYYENDAPGDKPHAPVQYLGVDTFVNVPPKPALRPANVLIADPFRAHVGGAQQISQPQVIPVWMGRNGTTNG